MDFKASAPSQPDYHLDLHHLDFIKDSVCQKTNKQKTELKQDCQINQSLITKYCTQPWQV